jgi:riboflavin biosynthesis pyrimidine reductase
MAMQAESPSIEVIIKDPVKHYRAPRDVVADNRLRHEEKRRILESWALDAQLIAVADEENMSGVQRPGLREAKLALLELELTPWCGRASRGS